MNKYIIELKWGLLFALMLLAWMLLEKISGLHDEHIDKHPIYTNLVAIPSIAIYTLALLDKRKNFYSGTMTYTQGFMTGLLVAIIVTILSPLTQYITITIITPDYFANVIKYSVETGKLTQEAAEKYFSLNNYIIQSLIGAPVMGVITTAIIAIFTRKKGK